MKNIIAAERYWFPTLAIVSLAAGLLFAQTTQAQQWVLQPEVRVGGEYDDNARLQSDDALVQEIDGFILEGSLGIGYNTERTTFELTPKLRSRVYDEIPDVDSDDQFLDVDFEHATLKSDFRIRGKYGRESQRTGERADPDIDVDDPDEIPTDETGDVFSSERRERVRIEPQWSYDITERLTVGLEASYMDVSYDDSITSDLVDYTDQRVEGSLARAFTERMRGYIGARARNYDNELGTNEVDGVSAVIGIESDISETTRFQAEVGYEDTERVLTGESDSNVVGNLSLVRRLETVTLLAQYRRDIASSGSGQVTARDSLNFILRKDFTERVSGGLGLRAYQNEAVGDEALSSEERDFIEFRARLAVALSQAFSVEADYRHARVERSGGVAGDTSADSNGIILWLIYRPTPIVN